MADPAPRFRLRTLFGATTAVTMTCALAAMLATMPATRVAEWMCILGIGLGIIVGYRRAGTYAERGLAAGLFILGALPLCAYVALVGGVWQEWNRADSNGLSIGAGMLVICLLTPAAAVLAVLLLRSWTWSAYDSHPLLPAAEPAPVFEGDV